MKTMLISALIFAGFSGLLAAPDDQSELTAFFPDISGFSKSAPPAFYYPENLYEYINGAAENYLGYNFQIAGVQNYTDANGKILTLEIYKHSDARNTFGIYSSEKPLKGNYRKIGTQGYLEEGVCNFFYGLYYVKISGYDLEASVQSSFPETAGEMVKKMGEQPGMPEEIAVFAENGKQENSERFILQNLFGQPFLRSGFICDFRINEKSFQVFLIRGENQDDARKMLSKWMELAKMPAPDAPGKKYSFSDPFNGPVILDWSGDSLIGALGAPDEGVAGKLIDAMKKKLSGIKN